MLTHRWPFKATVSAAAALLALLLTTCGGSPNPSPTPDPRIDQVSERLDQLAKTVRRLEEPMAGAPALETQTSTGTLQSSEESTTTATLTPLAPTGTPAPTPNPKNSDWVKVRLDAVIALYGLTDAGTALLRSLDLRQMRGDPGFFGSFGFREWAGVGEAKPIGVIHELGHSYWGGFPIEGAPNLSWDIPPGATVSPAIQRYHADILAFMSQPPDDYEMFRQRLRNLPDLSSDNQEPLFHNLEGDLVYNTGGNLTLVPPILRKYWSQFLRDGPFDSWYDAIGWFQSLTDEDRATASKYLGFEHLDLREYGPLEQPNNKFDLIPARRKTLAREERQRLFDLADQFDLLLGDPQKEENFQFWRHYLRDKVELHRLHGDYLASLDLPGAANLASALEILAGLPGLTHDEQARRLAEELPHQPFLVNFLPALDNRTLLELFASGTPLPQGATFQATASFVERLERFGGVVGGVLASGRADSVQGATQLLRFLEDINYEPKDDLRLFFELLRDEDPATASQVIQKLDKKTVRRLMEPVPVQLRFSLTPDELLEKLDITAEADVFALKRGISILVEEPSGNFIIDEPFLDLMYEVISARRRAEIRDMMRVLQETPLRLERFIQKQPEAAIDLLDSDLDAALRLVRESDPLTSPPVRIIYRLINADPGLAARLIQALDELAESELVVETLAYIAYDRSRSERVPGLPISLEQDGKFLRALLKIFGESGLTRRLAETFAVYGDRAATGQVPADFLFQYSATLEAAAATVTDASVRKQLKRIIEQVSGEHSVAR